MANLWNDLKHSLRSLFKNPGFTIAAVAALALGIGTNTAVFTVVNTVLLKPLTYPDADRIVQFLLTSPEGKGPAASPTKFNNWRQQTSVLQDVAAYDFGGPGFNLTGDHPEQVHGIHVSEAYFRLFGATPIVGRTFTADEFLKHMRAAGVNRANLIQMSFYNPHPDFPREKIPARTAGGD